MYGQVAPGVYLNSPRWMSNPLAIELNPQVPVDSVVHLIPLPHEGHRHAYGPIPAPPALKGMSRELRSLRRATVWRSGNRDEQVAAMEEWFPDTPKCNTKTPEPEDRDVAMVDPSVTSPNAPTKTSDNAPGCPSSNIGIFSKLPGEIRNRIYRLAMLEPDTQSVTVKTEPGTCTSGACIHSKVSSNLPGIASTCRQLRWESAPIFLAENKRFMFDDGVVRQCCVNNYLRTLGSYADLIHEFSFELQRPIYARDAFIEYLTYTFTLCPPKGDDGAFSLKQHEKGDRKICQCPLDKLIGQMNKRKFFDKDLSVGSLVQEFVDSEEFSDFVWRTHKTKQWTTHLPKCKHCKEVYFNN